MYQVIELNQPGDVTSTIGPVGDNSTLYDALHLTYRGRVYGAVNRIQYFTETTPHGTAVVLQLRFAHITLDILLNPHDNAAQAILEALAKQPTLPVYHYTADPGGGRDLLRRQVLAQPILVRKSIADCLKVSLANNRTLSHVSWLDTVVLYQRETRDRVMPTSADDSGNESGTPLIV